MQLKRKDWDSDFFGRDFYLLDITDGLEIDELENELDRLDKAGVFGTECQLNIRSIDAMANLEALGFRLVDSRMEFVTHTFRGEYDIVAPVGEFRRYQSKDWDALAEITL